MKYFAYGSNMSISRLKERVPSADCLGCYSLKEHDLRFHKSGKDDSGKCDAFYTGNSSDTIFGVLFQMNPDEKAELDRAESLGRGYDEKLVTVIDLYGEKIEATTYIAKKINNLLKPYSWYLNHVLVGAEESSLPGNYIDEKIRSIDSVEDSDKARDTKERAIHN